MTQHEGRKAADSVDGEIGGECGSDSKVVCLQCERPRFNLWGGKIPWRREWQPTPVFLPGEFYGQRSLAGYSLCGCKKFNTTEQICLSVMTMVKREKPAVLNAAEIGR